MEPSDFSGVLSPSWHGLSRRREDADLLGQCAKMQKLRYYIHQFAPHDVPVLLIGEESTGMRLIAEVIHGLSRRREGPFIALDCAIHSDIMLVVELFGLGPELFVDLREGLLGKLEIASGGTLFLDHLEVLPKAVQGRLLRTLEARTVERLGSNTTLPVDVRIVGGARTGIGANLPTGVLQGGLLAYLSGGLPLMVPPLHERGIDIILLSHHFLEQANHTLGTHVRGLSSEALALLSAYTWPGNVLELKNCIWYGAQRAEVDITSAHLPLRIRAMKGHGW